VETQKKNYSEDLTADCCNRDKNPDEDPCLLSKRPKATGIKALSYFPSGNATGSRPPMPPRQ